MDGAEKSCPTAERNRVYSSRLQLLGFGFVFGLIFFSKGKRCRFGVAKEQIAVLQCGVQVPSI